MAVVSAETAWKLVDAVTDAENASARMPVQRTVGAGYGVQADMVIGIPIPLWDAVIEAANRLALVLPDDTSEAEGLADDGTPL